MGNGTYHKVGFGMFQPRAKAKKGTFWWKMENDPDFETDSVVEAWAEKLGITLQTAYEANRNYLMIPLAIDNDLAGEEEVELTFCGLVSELASDLEDLIGPLARKAAKENWEKLRKLAAKEDIDIPEGALIIVTDYD